MWSEAPGEPGGEAAQASGRGSRRPPRSGRSPPCCPCRGSETGAPPGRARRSRIERADVTPLLHGDRADARQRLAALVREEREVADHEDLGMSGNGEVRLDRRRGRSGRAERRGSCRRGRPRRPRPRGRSSPRCAAAGHEPGLRPPASRARRCGPRRRAAGAPRPRFPRSAPCSSGGCAGPPRSARRGPRAGRCGESRPRGRDRRSRRSPRRARHRSARRRRWRTSGALCRRSGSVSRSASSKASRMRRRISSASSRLLRPGARDSQSSCPKYACRAPEATTRVVVGEEPPSRERDLAPVRVDRNGLGQHDVRVLLAAQNRPDGVGDVGRREGRRRDLIEERLEEVMVAPVDHRDPDRSAGEAARRFESSESGAHDHDVRPSV